MFQQTQGTQYQQQPMSQPPAILTNKDSLYLKDILSWELLANKKALHLAANCQDNTVRQVLEQAGEMHQRHYQRLLRHLDAQTQQHNQQEYSQHHP